MKLRKHFLALPFLTLVASAGPGCALPAAADADGEQAETSWSSLSSTQTLLAPTDYALLEKTLQDSILATRNEIAALTTKIAATEASNRAALTEINSLVSAIESRRNELETSRNRGTAGAVLGGLFGFLVGGPVGLLLGAGAVGSGAYAIDADSRLNALDAQLTTARTRQAQAQRDLADYTARKAKLTDDLDELRTRESAIREVFVKSAASLPTTLRFADPVVVLENKELRSGATMRSGNHAEVYVVYGGARFWVPTPIELASYYGGFGPVQVLGADQAERVGTTPVDGTLLRERDQATVYVMLNGRACAIPSPDVLLQYGTWNDVRVVPPGALAHSAIAMGAAAPLTAPTTTVFGNWPAIGKKTYRVMLLQELLANLRAQGDVLTDVLALAQALSIELNALVADLKVLRDQADAMVQSQRDELFKILVVLLAADPMAAALTWLDAAVAARAKEALAELHIPAVDYALWLVKVFDKGRSFANNPTAALQDELVRNIAASIDRAGGADWSGVVMAEADVLTTAASIQ